METTRQAHATWSGNLNDGGGTVRSGSSGAIPETGITWKARTEEPGGMTSPEELLAAAHAACFSMAFANQLAKAGFAPDSVATTATIVFRKLDAGWTVISSTLDVRAKVPGVDAATFQELAGVAKDGCPISRAIKGNVELAVNATLEA
jgi:osmotically inducible protein OsmC